MATQRTKIGLKEVRALRLGEIVWDSSVSGFHARRQKSTTVSYIVVYRNAEGRQRWQTIGRHGSPWTPDTAREAAKRILGLVVDGADPAADKRAKRQAADVTALCDLYIGDVEAGRLLTRRKTPKKASTLATDKGRIERHIKPLLGRMKVAAVTSADIEHFLHSVSEGETAGKTKTDKKRGMAHVRGGKGTASRTVGLLGGIFTYAVKHRMRMDNPVKGVVRHADGKRQRRMSDDEYRALGAALPLAADASVWPPALAVARFLALTGWRSGEALGLTWREVDLVRRTATLGDTKTGLSIRPLSHLACDVLRSAQRSGDDTLVFPASRGTVRMSGFPKFWSRIAKLGAISQEVTPHTLRHSFASLAGDLGYSETTIAALVGHKGRSMTSRYIHAADAVLLTAADAIANRTAVLMGLATEPGTVVQLAKRA